MRTPLRFPSLLAGLCAGAFASPWLQDPPPAPPSPQDPPAATSPTAKEVPGRAAVQPIEGVYTLRARVIDNKTDRLPSRGYLAITHKHLFLHLVAPGPDAEKPLLRSGVRSWRTEKDYIDATIQLGWYTDRDGKVCIEKQGTNERRRIELIRGGVRVMQDDSNWLEFERIE